MIGASSIAAVGRNRPPFPWIYTSYDGDNSKQFGEEHIGIALACPTHHSSRDLPEGVSAALIRDRGRRLGVGVTPDGHREGSIEMAIN
jgi:hypothetical protein